MRSLRTQGRDGVWLVLLVAVLHSAVLVDASFRRPPPNEASELWNQLEKNPVEISDEVIESLWDEFDDEPEDDSTKKEVDITKMVIGDEPTSSEKKNHPVVIVPGIISTQLEVWKATGRTTRGNAECFPFREKFWTPNPLTLMDPSCMVSFIRNIMLDPQTGLDPPHAKLRAITGLQGADYFTTTSKTLGWLWQPLFQRLAEEGYDNNNIFLAGYDWRLSWKNLEVRDHYFTRLREMVLSAVQTNGGKKAVIITHSMGSTVYYYFMQWLSHSKNEPNFIEENVHAWINVGGTLLGAPKVARAVMTGELFDASIFTGLLANAQLPAYASWGSIMGVMPKGGDSVWRSDQKEGVTFSEHPTARTYKDIVMGLWSAPGALLAEQLDGLYGYDSSVYYSWDRILDLMDVDFKGSIYERIREQLGDHDFHYYASPPETTTERMYDNPLAAALPNAPDMTVYSFYGVRQETDVGFYMSHKAVSETKEDSDIGIDTALHYNEDGVKISAGAVRGDGDATVPLASLGFMSVCAWKRHGQGTHNPSGMKTVTREYDHEAGLWAATLGRGQNTVSGDHVDILMNAKFMDDVVTVVSGGTVAERVTSETESHFKSLKSELCVQRISTDTAVDDAIVDAPSALATARAKDVIEEEY